MKVLLDTNICIYMIKNKPPEVRKRFEQFVPGDIGISAITVAELQYGVTKSAAKEKAFSFPWKLWLLIRTPRWFTEKFGLTLSVKERLSVGWICLSRPRLSRRV